MPATAAATDGAAAADVPLPTAVDSPRFVACSFRSMDPIDREDRDGDHQALKLRFASGTTPFAEVPTYQAIYVDVGVGPAPLTTADIELGSVSLHAALDLGALALHAGRPFVIGGLFIPQEYTDLSWEDGKPGQATVSIRLDRVQTSRDRLRATRPCSDISLGWRWFSAEDRAGEPDSIGSGDLIGNRIAIADAATNRAAAMLMLRAKDDRQVDVLAVEGTKTRIVFYGDSALVIGWVSSSAVQRNNAGGSRDYFPNSSGIGYGTFGAPSHVVCRSRIPLVARVGGEEHTVGVVQPGARIGVLERGEAFTVVNFERVPLLAVEGAQLLVRSGDLADCLAR